MKDKKLPYNPELTNKERILEHFEVNSKYSFQDLVDLGTSEQKMLENYELVEDTDVEEKVQLAGTGRAFPNAKSSQDTEDFLVRYKYAGTGAPQRAFCRGMMSAGKIYRKEDIDRMSGQSVNPGFGPNGSNTYDIWLWKGGGMRSANFPQGTCKHFWKKLIYKARVESGGETKVGSRTDSINATQARSQGAKIEVNDSRVARKPHNM